MLFLYVAIGSAMLALGFWQMARAAEKIALQALADEAALQAPVELSMFDSAVDLPDYTRLALTGILEPDRQFLWDNRIFNGRAGFEVIVPLRLVSSDQLDGATLILVNRGWIAPGPSREDLPSVAFPHSGELQLMGTLTRPSTGFSSGPAVSPDSAQWPKILQHFDYSELEQLFGEPVVPGVVQLDRKALEASQTLAMLPVLADNWQPVASGPERHYGYAFQWWAMFAALTVLFLLLNLTKRTEDSPL